MDPHRPDKWHAIVSAVSWNFARVTASMKPWRRRNHVETVADPRSLGETECTALATARRPRRAPRVVAEAVHDAERHLPFRGVQY